MSISTFLKGLIFGGQEVDKGNIPPKTEDEIKSETNLEVAKLEAQKKIINAKIELRKAQSKYNELMPKGQQSGSIFSSKVFWIVVVAIIFIIAVIKAVAG